MTADRQTNRQLITIFSTPPGGEVIMMLMNNDEVAYCQFPLLALPAALPTVNNEARHLIFSP